MRNDTDWIGLHPLIARYAYLMAENTLTLRTADVMLRIIALLTAKTDKERAASIEYLKSIEKGELGVIGESQFHEGVEMQSPPSNNGSYLTQFIEYQQYLKGSFYNEIGLSANYNMKREAIGKGESTLDEDALLPLCDNMLKCRQEDLVKVNKMFGTNIEVEFSSSWLTNRIEMLSALKQLQTSPFGSVPGMGLGSVGEGSNPEDGEDGEDGEDVQNVNDVEAVENDEFVEVDEDGEDVFENINDLSVDEELTEILEEIVEEPEVPMVNQFEGGEESDKTDEESSEDKTDTPDK